MSRAPHPTTLRLPRMGSSSPAALWDQTMEQLERADARSVKTRETPTLPAVILIAADGSTWRVTVSAAGVLTTTAVPRA